MVELRRRAGAPPAIADPLEAAHAFLERNGSTDEGLTFRRVIRTLLTGQGQYFGMEINAFSPKALGLIAALMEARDLGRYSKKEWLRIV